MFEKNITSLNDFEIIYLSRNFLRYLKNSLLFIFKYVYIIKKHEIFFTKVVELHDIY